MSTLSGGLGGWAGVVAANHGNPTASGSGGSADAGDAGGGGSGGGGVSSHLSKELLFSGDTSFITRLLAGIKAGKGEPWARSEFHDYTQGLVNLALDRESGLLGVLSAPGLLLKVRDVSRRAGG